MHQRRAPFQQLAQRGFQGAFDVAFGAAFADVIAVGNLVDVRADLAKLGQDLREQLQLDLQRIWQNSKKTVATRA